MKVPPKRVDHNFDHSKKEDSEILSRPMSISESVTEWLHLWRGGDDQAIERVTDLVYQDLRRMAAYYLAGESSAHTLQPTALVHEAYLRMRSIREFDWKERDQFIAVVAKMMRRILVDHARARNAAKRDGSQELPPTPSGDHSTLDILAVDQALELMAERYPRCCKIVELRFFRRLGISGNCAASGYFPEHGGARVAFCSRLATNQDDPFLNLDEGRLPELFERAAALSPNERERFLADQCGGSGSLLAEIRALLEADDLAAQNRAWDHSALENEAAHQAGGAAASVGESVGPYRLVELIGTGGMGKVYRALRSDSEYDQNVAIKRIKAGFDGEQIVARFRAERQILANLEHPNIARLLDGGTDSKGMPYLVMEFIDGMPPLDYCQANSLPTRARLVLFREICSAVHYAHQRMVVHRDLKPGNILVTPQGVPKLLDFGIAKVLAPAVSSGTAAETEPYMMTARYCSPEQVRAEPITTASDVYSLGVILYELLTAVSPYRNCAGSSYETIQAVCNEEPRPPSSVSSEIGRDLDTIILKALRKNPAERYSSVDRLSEDIQRYLNGRPVLARRDTFTYVASKFVTRHKVSTAAAGLVLCGLVVSFVAVTRAQARAERRFNEVRELAHSVIFDYHDAIELLPGSTAVRERLVKDALKYLDSLSKDVESADLQREMVDAFVRISNVQGDSYHGNLGKNKGALESARKGADAAEKLLRMDGSAIAKRSASAAFAVEGTLLYSAGDLHTAEGRLQRAVNLDEDNVRAQPTDIDSLVSLTTNLRKLADLYGGNGMQNLGDSTKAMSLYQRAKDIALQLSARFPQSVRARKESYHALIAIAGTEQSSGHADEAAADLRKAVALIQIDSDANGNDAPAQMELANASAQLGQMLLNARKASEALPYFTKSSNAIAHLSKTDPQNALYRRSLAVVETQLAAALRAAGDPQAALPHSQKALKLAEALSEASPSSREYRADVGIDTRKLAETMISLGKGTVALELSSQAVAILCGTTAGLQDAYLQANCGRAVLFVGHSEMLLNRPGEAAQSYRRAEQMAAKLSQKDPVNAILRSDLARSEASMATALTQLHKYEEAHTAYARAAGGVAQAAECPRTYGRRRAPGGRHGAWPRLRQCTYFAPVIASKKKFEGCLRFLAPFFAR